MFVEIGVMFVMLWAGIRFGMRARAARRSDVKWALLGAVLGLAGGFVLGTGVNVLGGSALVGAAGLAVALGLCELAGRRMIRPAGPQSSLGVSGSFSGQTDPPPGVEGTNTADLGSAIPEELPAPEEKGSRRGTIIDFLLPLAIAQVAFFGTQAYLNSGGGFQVQLGIGMLFEDDDHLVWAIPDRDKADPQGRPTKLVEGVKITVSMCPTGNQSSHHRRALLHGARIVEKPEDRPWGLRQYTLEDPTE